MTSLTRSDRAALEGLLRARTTLPAPSRIAVQVAWAYLVWKERHKTRLALKDLDEHLLRDIGLTPDQAQREMAKPFWRP